jgi:hypothetical protein
MGKEGLGALEIEKAWECICPRSSTEPMKDYYKTLMVHPEADAEIIKAAYRRLAQLYHPDVYRKADAEIRMKEINEAYHVLGDRDQRERYDIERSLTAGGPEIRRPDYTPPPEPWKYAGIARVIIISFMVSLLAGFLVSQGIRYYRQQRPVTAAHLEEVIKMIESGDQSLLDRAVREKPKLLVMKDSDGKTLLRYAVESGKTGMAKCIINRGVDVDDGTKSGYTPLHAAAYQGYQDMAELLITAGASVNARTNRGHTPLHLASSRGHKEVAEYLISKGAEVNSTDREGETPLALAEKYGKTEIVELLKMYGAHP